MIVLDTNVISKILRPAPEHRVMAWLDEQPRASIFTSAVTQGDIFFGMRLLPKGQRRKKLWDAAGPGPPLIPAIPGPIRVHGMRRACEVVRR